jgi:uncharacterized membrane protein
VDARVLHRLLLFFLVVGLIFSCYAAFEVLDPALQRSCSLNAFLSCSAVDKSGHTNFGPTPIPDYAVGIAGFVAMLAVDVPLLRSYDPRLLYALLGLTTVGLAIAVGLGLVELTIIRAFCPICLGAYLSDAGAFLVAVALVRLRRSAQREATRARETAVPD